MPDNPRARAARANGQKGGRPAGRTATKSIAIRISESEARLLAVVAENHTHREILMAGVRALTDARCLQVRSPVTGSV